MVTMIILNKNNPKKYSKRKVNFNYNRCHIIVIFSIDKTTEREPQEENTITMDNITTQVNITT